jgi:small subunit ribosomal protein S14
MAKKSNVVQEKKLKIKSKFKVRVYNRCPLCGRRRAYMQYFDMCRICFRKAASNGDIVGIKKSSW